MEETNRVDHANGGGVAPDVNGQNVAEPSNMPEFGNSVHHESNVKTSEEMLIDNCESGATMNNPSSSESIVHKLVKDDCHAVNVTCNDQNIADNNCNMQYKVIENNTNDTDAENIEAMTIDIKSGNSVNSDAICSANITAPEISVENDMALNSIAVNEVNGNAVTIACVENVSESSVEAMVTEDSSESSEAVTKSSVNDQNHEFIMGEKQRDNIVVDAMNKDQSWKSDAVYQKDLSSLQLLCDYGSDSDEDNNVPEKKENREIENTDRDQTNKETMMKTIANKQDYRKPGVETISDSDEESDSSEDETTSSSSTATSSSSSDESEDSDNTSENDCVIVEEKKPASEIPKTKGELGLDDLPPIEDLHINVPESECVEIGKVLSIVDSLVVVQSMKGCPALDLDSVLFRDHGHSTLGQVFDVFGKVGEACYCVRFNSKDHAIQKGVEIGMPVYYAPRTEHSKFVFLADLMKMKGSDASWEHNNEPPPKFLDYSDDEEERRARKGDKPPCREVEPDETQPRAKKFNKKAPQRGMGRSSASPRPSSSRPWSTPFNRYPCPSPSPSPRPGPQPLIRPPSFQSPGPSESHFHNPAAGAPAMPATLSPWAVPPPAVSKEFNYNMNIANIPPPQPSFIHNQMRTGGFGQPPPRPSPPPPPPSPSSRNFLMPTCIPGAGPFSQDSLNAYRSDQNSFASNHSQFQGNPFRPDSRSDSFGATPQGPFGPQGPVFMNRNMPPPPPPQGW